MPRIPAPSDFEPSYLGLSASGELGVRARTAGEKLKDCDLCARYCRVDRTRTLEGAVCRTGTRAVVHSCGPHHGEEDPLRGSRGSGTIFFSWCNLRCVYCQNWEISQKGAGGEKEPEEIAGMMMRLQEAGCHNINFVSPSHVVPQILAAVSIAARRGLRLPLVYNTGGFDSLEALALLDGVIDIYMPDMKYADSAVGHALSKTRDYAEVNRAAVLEMHRQVGDLKLDSRGVARRGLLIRHLVLPGGRAGTAETLAWIASTISLNTYLNLMDQYHPCYRADEYPPLTRPLRREEFLEAVRAAERCGLSRLAHRAP